MGRKLTIVLIALIVLGITFEAQAGNLKWDGWRWKSCHVNKNGGPWNVKETKRVTRCAIDHWKVNSAMVFMIGNHESGFYALAGNSCCKGVFAHDLTYWPARVSIHNQQSDGKRMDVKPGIYNARSNVLVAVRMMKTGGFGPWCGYASYC